MMLLSEALGILKKLCVVMGISLLLIPSAFATSVYNPFRTITVSVKLEKGLPISEAVARIMASARERDVMEIDPAYKGFAKIPLTIRDADLAVKDDLVIENATFGLAVNQLCEATGAAFQYRERGDGWSEFLFFRNSDYAIRDVFYDLPSSFQGEGLIRRLKASHFIPGPGECMADTLQMPGVWPIRAGNRCHAALQKLLAEESKR